MEQFVDTIKSIQAILENAELLGKTKQVSLPESVHNVVNVLLGDLNHLYTVEHSSNAKAIEISQMVMQEYTEFSKHNFDDVKLMQTPSLFDEVSQGSSDYSSETVSRSNSNRQ